MIFVLGSHGRIGRAITGSFAEDSVVAPGRDVYARWWCKGAADDVSRYFESAQHDGGIVYIAAGVIDPKKPAEDHQRVNFLLPRNVIVGATRLGLRVVSFGSIMEEIVEGATNPYFASKIQLGNFVEAFASTSPLVLHIRIHTLYGGGLPDRFMFLGQLLQAIASRSGFNMSAGTQLREYHHIDDEVAAISALVAAETSGVVNLSHGEPVTLRDLASYIFEQFDCSELLRIGSLAAPPNDNFGMAFERPPLLADTAFRDTLPSVVEYLRFCEKLPGARYCN